jgi:hypothetical protein
MAQKTKTKDEALKFTAIVGAGGWLLYQLFLNPSTVQQVGQVVSKCCGK